MNSSMTGRNSVKNNVVGSRRMCKSSLTAMENVRCNDAFNMVHHLICRLSFSAFGGLCVSNSNAENAEHAESSSQSLRPGETDEYILQVGVRGMDRGAVLDQGVGAEGAVHEGVDRFA